MMSRRILLTSFQTWLPHQPANSADELLRQIQERQFPGTSLAFGRQLPVDIAPASQQAIAQIEQVQPELVICCGMAESRYQLTLESNATWSDGQLKTNVELDALVRKLSQTEISHDAGKFVCEGLYYQVLRHLQLADSPCSCLFVHVPRLTASNLPEILADFATILDQVILGMPRA